MGADLYIHGLKGDYGIFEVSTNAVESGYFRDCYNAGGLFAIIAANVDPSFSWWAFRQNKSWFDAQGNMPPTAAQELLVKVKKAAKQLKALPELYYQDYDLDKKVFVRGRRVKNPQEYHRWIDLLIRFLEMAIELNRCIEWSV